MCSPAGTPLLRFLILLNICCIAFPAAATERPRARSASEFAYWMNGVPVSQGVPAPSSPDNWLGGAGNWSNGADWSAGEPGGGSDVFINTGDDNVTLDVNASINSLTLGGASGSSTLQETAGRGLELSIAGTLTINHAGTLTFVHDALISGGASSNAGTINLSGQAQLQVNNTLTNTGTINLMTSSMLVANTLTNSGGIIGVDGFIDVVDVGTLTNSGSIVTNALIANTATNQARATIAVQGLLIGGNLTNEGDVMGMARGSQLNVGGQLINSGTFDTSYANGTLGSLDNLASGEVIVGMLTINGNSSNAGGIGVSSLGINEPTVSLQINGNLTNTGGLDVTGAQGAPAGAGVTGSVNNSGSIFLSSGGNFGAGNITNSGMIITGQFGSNGGNNFYASSLTNQAGGVFAIDGMSDLANVGSITNSGAISVGNGATLTVPPSSHAVGTALSGFLNNGIVQIATGGKISSLNKYTQTAGQTTIDGTLQGASNFAGGAVYGNGGTIQGNVTSNAAFNMGDMPNTVGTMAITGNYTQGANGSLAFDIASLTSFDQLNVSGHANLNGTLFVDLLNGYVPQIGNMFDIMNFAGESGSFSMTVGLPINNNEHFVLEYNANNLTLDVVSGPDQQTTAGKGSGYYEPYVSQVTEGVNQVGNNESSAGLSSVPEPGSLLLLASGILGIFPIRRKKPI